MGKEMCSMLAGIQQKAEKWLLEWCTTPQATFWVQTWLGAASSDISTLATALAERNNWKNGMGIGSLIGGLLAGAAVATTDYLCPGYLENLGSIFKSEQERKIRLLERT